MKKIFQWIHKNPYLGLSKTTEVNAVYTVIALLFAGYYAVIAAVSVMDMWKHGFHVIPSPAQRFFIALGAFLLLGIFFSTNYYYNQKNKK